MYLHHSSLNAITINDFTMMENILSVICFSCNGSSSICNNTAGNALSMPRKKLMIRWRLGSWLYSSRKKIYKLMAIPGAMERAKRIMRSKLRKKAESQKTVGSREAGVVNHQPPADLFVIHEVPCHFADYKFRVIFIL